MNLTVRRGGLVSHPITIERGGGGTFRPTALGPSLLPHPLGRPNGPAVLHWPGHTSPCGPSLIPGSLGLRLHVSRENEHPPPGGHLGPGRQTPRKAAWVLPAGVCSPGTRAGHLRLRRPGACLGSFLWHRLEGALGLPAPAAHQCGHGRGLGPAPGPPM